MAAELPKRIAVAAVGIPSAFALVYFGGWALVVLIAALGAVGVREFLAMAHTAGGRPHTGLGVIGAIVVPALALALLTDGLDPRWAVVVSGGWVFAVLTAAVVTYREGRPAVLSVSTTVFAVVYASVLPSALLWLRHGVPDATAMAATWLVFFPLGMTWICDTFAMTGGSLIGGPKFAPAVSPNKTWAGAISGLVGAVLVAVLFASYVFERLGLGIPTWAAIQSGLAVGVFGQVGDLAESAFKRSVKTKDSGTFFPGHGGVLDRMDSLYWSLPLIAFILFAHGVL